MFIRNVEWHRGVGGALAHHDTVGDSIVHSLVRSKVGPYLLMLDHGLKVGRLASEGNQQPYGLALCI